MGDKNFIAGIGCTNVDILYSGIDRLPNEGEEIYAKHFSLQLGGGGCILCFIFSITDSFAIEIPLLSFAVFFLFRPLIQLMEYNIFYYVFR